MALVAQTIMANLSLQCSVVSWAGGLGMAVMPRLFISSILDPIPLKHLT